MKLEAKLLPLEGKYYGTIIELELENGTYEEIEININRGADPSERELNGTPLEEYEICDNHYECKDTYNLALELLKRINNVTETGEADHYLELQNSKS